MNVSVRDAQNASVCPSDEDSQTFYVNASNGDSFRLKGKEHLHCAYCLYVIHDAIVYTVYSSINKFELKCGL